MVTWNNASFKVVSFHIIEGSCCIYLGPLKAFFFLCLCFYNYVNRLEILGPSGGSLISKSVIDEILGILWVCSMVFLDSFICLLVHLLNLTHTHTHAYTHAHARTHTCIHTHTHTWQGAGGGGEESLMLSETLSTHTCIHTHTHTHTHTCIHTCIHTCTCMHTHMHTHAHTHTHTHTHGRGLGGGEESLMLSETLSIWYD
jgi:hypothetical protein